MPLHIIRQDITKLKVDAIVNTTNQEMIGYSGVDFAVHAMPEKNWMQNVLVLRRSVWGRQK